jgi:hypothetical protein
LVHRNGFLYSTFQRKINIKTQWKNSYDVNQMTSLFLSLLKGFEIHVGLLWFIG